MAASFAPAEGASTLIACTEDGRRLGYIHLRPGKDGVTDEPCGYISLLATTKDAEGSGVATRLMAARRGLGARARLSPAQPRRVRRQSPRRGLLSPRRLQDRDPPHGEAAIATRARMAWIAATIEALIDAPVVERLHRRLETGVAPLRRIGRIARRARLHPPARHEEHRAQPGQPPHRHEPWLELHRPPPCRCGRDRSRRRPAPRAGVSGLPSVGTPTASRSAASRAQDRSRPSRHAPSRDRRTRRCRRDRR